METTLSHLAVDATLSDIVWFFFVGLLIVGFLLAGFKLGQRVRAKEPPPPEAETQPHLPEGGAVHEVREERDPVDIPEGGLRPHEMQGYGNFGSTASEHPDEVRKRRESGYQRTDGPGPHPQPGSPPDSGRGAHA
ncbi:MULTISPECIES: DUF6479 family protein [Streptomyces]|jgi:hypothetical protein|uniref:DUF6479 family protein n=1 Tax=Streptomyces TaxID=1883 RepID=UPI000F740AB0|nr:DUF6479 family protein [Streptomyces sp. WAC05292]RSS97107.1 hypothetical protein EF903_02110 [Streptomyces sp. WAC05292]